MGRRLHMLSPDTGLDFPPVAAASPEGLLAVGGDLRPERLLLAYRRGIFPWYSDGQPILWWSPDPRAVLFPEKLKVSRSLRKTLRQRTFTLTFDTCFRDVMLACTEPRDKKPDGGTWITPAMVEAYVKLHALGHAHSVEAWQENKLVGGLYGIALGGVFFGESMFARATDASKIVLVHLVRQLARWGYTLIDCQQYTAHLARFGAEEIPRSAFLHLLAQALALPDRPGRWMFETNGQD
jgi:leucyl/phenylalanyl-tRNA--protein transferase